MTTIQRGTSRTSPTCVSVRGACSSADPVTRYLSFTCSVGYNWVMTNTSAIFGKLAVSAAVLATLAGCSGTPQPAYAPVAYDDDLFESALCVDTSTGLRVFDWYCPSGGDNEGLTNGNYRWVYSAYRSAAPDIEVVYVGYPVNRSRYGTFHDRRVRTYNIDRGRAPVAPAAGQPLATSVRIDPAPAAVLRSSSVRRGGLGVPGAAGTAAPTPVPNRAGAAPGPTNRALPPAQGAAAASTGTSGPRGATAVPKPAPAATAPVAAPRPIPAPPAYRPAPAPVRSAPVKTGK